MTVLCFALFVRFFLIKTKFDVEFRLKECENVLGVRFFWISVAFCYDKFYFFEKNVSPNLV